MYVSGFHLSFKFHPSAAPCPGSGTEIFPDKYPDTRIKPLPLTNGHGRYITVAPEWTRLSVGEWPLHIAVFSCEFLTVSLPKRLRKGRFNSETTTWIQKWFKIPAGTSELLKSSIYNSFSRRGRWAWL
jgi:hypothetical protein